ncbi:MAG: TolC family protein [Gemmataceae bacterium]|nr:TolC family protein [Gemmataceae bacterium]
MPPAATPDRAAASVRRGPGRWLSALGLVLLGGCALWHRDVPIPDMRDRILAPETAATAEKPSPAPSEPGVETLPPPRPVDAVDPPPVPPTVECNAPEVFTLEAAIAFALQNNPRLRAARAAIDEARGNRQAAFAPFLPEATFKPTAFWGNNPKGPPGAFAIPLPEYSDAPGYQTYQVAELYMQWTVLDFGRREGRYAQASLRVDITELQATRADQTVAFDVTAAYFRVLLAQATRTVAQQAVREAESILELTRNLFNRGVVTRDSVLRAEVQLSTDQQLLVSARSHESIARAGLNFAMGRNVSASIEVTGGEEEPSFHMSLAEGLQLAVDNRREFQVARKAIEVAQEGVKVAHAEFAPRIYLQGVAAGETGHQTLRGASETGAIILSWRLFDGGKRLGDNRAAGAQVNTAVAQAQHIADTIAYEVNQAFYAVDDARQRIVLARTSIAQARENLRLVLNKYKAGDATPTDVVDAETTLTRSQQSYNTALYDYQTALARLDYAMGTTPAGFAGRGACRPSAPGANENPAP